MKLSKKASAEYLARKDIAFKSITYDFGINIYDIDINGEYIIWGYSNEDICRISKLKYNYKTEDYLFRAGHDYYNTNDFYNVYEM